MVSRGNVVAGVALGLRSRSPARSRWSGCRGKCCRCRASHNGLRASAGWQAMPRAEMQEVLHEDLVGFARIIANHCECSRGYSLSGRRRGSMQNLALPRCANNGSAGWRLFKRQRQQWSSSQGGVSRWRRAIHIESPDRRWLIGSKCTINCPPGEDKDWDKAAVPARLSDPKNELFIENASTHGKRPIAFDGYSGERGVVAG